MNLQQMLDQAIALQGQGRVADAERLYARLLEAVPDNAALLFNHGTALKDLGRFAEALARFNQALLLEPGFVPALVNQGACLRLLREPEKAFASFSRALTIAPRDPGLMLNQGIVLAEMGRFEEAIGRYDEALRTRADYPQALNGRGLALAALKRFEEALASYDAALAIQPDYLEALHNRGQALYELRRYDAALASFEAVLALDPGNEAGWNNLGLVQSGMGRFEAALKSFDAALESKPGDPDALYNRGRQLMMLDRLGEAQPCFEAILAAEPDHAEALAELAETSLRLCDWDRVAKIRERLKPGILAGRPVITPFFLIGYDGDPALQRRCAENHVRKRIGARPQPLWRGTPRRDGKIRIAYLSADFHEHATAYLMAGLFERHDRERFDITALSFGEDKGGAMRDRLAKAFDRFVDGRTMSDREAAQFLNANKVDIAIDLKGLTDGNRLGIFSHRPAPIQVSYLGYPGTTGADFMDYVIADAVVAPFAHQDFFTEKIVHLPGCYQVNDSKRVLAGEAPPRKSVGLPEQGFVFCCFNINWKITAPLFDIWMRLLAAVPGSVLWLIDNGIGEHFGREAAARGIAPGRLVFAPRVGLAQHLARHRLADLFLDTLPCNAHTTASDALWAGLPVLTVKGAAFAGRVAASLNGAAGLGALVTENLSDYESLALKLAREPQLLQSFRYLLEQNRLTAPLFDTGRFARAIEAAYLRMWEIAERGEAPRSFAVEEQGV